MSSSEFNRSQSYLEAKDLIFRLRKTADFSSSKNWLTTMVGKSTGTAAEKEALMGYLK